MNPAGSTVIRPHSLAARFDPRANGLNLLRLVLAATVIVSHAWPLGGLGEEPSFAGHTLGTWAVFGFFALSGYLITGSRLNNGMAEFVKRRVLRLYPGFLVCLLVTVLVVAPIGYLAAHHSLHGYLSTPTTPIDYVASNLALKMNAFHVAGTPGNSHAWTSTLWTLYYEFACYLVVGLLATWRAFRRSPAVAVGLLAVLTVIGLAAPSVRAFTSNRDVLHMIDLLPWFMAGACLYLLRERVPCRWWTAMPALGVLVAVPVGLPDRFVVLCAFPMALFLMWLGVVVSVPIARSNDISYGVYMYSGAVQQLLTLAGVQRHGTLLYIGLSLLCTVPVAAASWVLVERPMMQRGRRRRGTAVAGHSPSRQAAAPTALSAAVPIGS